jgi:transcriptional regulator with XRE-family HTH domain
MSNRKAHGPAIRGIREALGISLRTCATDVNLSPGYLSRIESGDRQPTDAVITRIAQRLGVTTDQVTYPHVREGDAA